MVTDQVPKPLVVGNELAPDITFAPSVAEPEHIDCPVPALDTGVITPFKVRSSIIKSVPVLFPRPYNLKVVAAVLLQTEKLRVMSELVVVNAGLVATFTAYASALVRSCQLPLVPLRYPIKVMEVKETMLPALGVKVNSTYLAVFNTDDQLSLAQALA